jgi:hypothetical protein
VQRTGRVMFSESYLISLNLISHVVLLKDSVLFDCINFVTSKETKELNKQQNYVPYVRENPTFTSSYYSNYKVESHLTLLRCVIPIVLSQKYNV